MSFALRASALALLALPLLAFAQDAPPPTRGVPTTAVPAGTVNCFDYYHFGSVQVDVTPAVASAVSGTPITFTGTIKNQNPYPVTDGAVYIKIFRQRGDDTKNSNGPDVVDQFYAMQNVSVAANGEEPIQFSWNVPSYAVSGKYRVATFFTVARKFNLLGLPFTDDVVGNSADFKVAGEQKATVGFKKEAVTVAGDKYHFAAFPPRVDAAAPVIIEAQLVNPTDAPVTVPVAWTLYSWSGNDDANKLTSRSEPVTIPAGGTARVSFTANDAQYPVYVLTGVAKWKDASSIINVRLVRAGKDRLRINFPSLMSFPLTAGKETTIFSCLHNSGESASVPDGRLVLTLLDKSQRLIHSYTYAGDVTGAMMGVAEKFVPRKTYDTFELQAELYQGSTLVDKSTVAYRCSDIDARLCSPESMSRGLAAYPFIDAIAAILAVAGVSYVARRFYKPGRRKF